MENRGKKILIMGLGNPGKKYIKTRHNVGFRTLDLLQKNYNFSAWKNFKTLALIAEDTICEVKIILAKPQIFMNSSGLAAKKIILDNNFPAADLWIVHDDMDLPLGKIRIVKNRGAAGHKGVESIIREIKTQNFIRIRIGIKRQGYRQKKYGAEFVTGKFTGAEEKIIWGAVKLSVRAIKTAICDGLIASMNKYNV